MARPKKNKDEKDPATIKPVKNEPPKQESTNDKFVNGVLMAGIDNAKPDITIINVASDNDVLAKLDLQEKQESEKLKKVEVPKLAPTVNLAKLGTGMVAYYDNKLGKQGTEKANIFSSMLKFNPNRYRLL